MTDDLLVCILAPDDGEFTVQWADEHIMKFSDHGCQILHTVSRVELQTLCLETEVVHQSKPSHKPWSVIVKPDICEALRSLMTVT